MIAPFRTVCPAGKWFDRLEPEHDKLITAILIHAGGGARDAARLIAAEDAAAEPAGGLTFPAAWRDADRARFLRDLHAVLDEDTFAAVWANGQALSVDAALAVALAGLDATAGARASDQRSMALPSMALPKEGTALNAQCRCRGL